MIRSKCLEGNVAKAAAWNEGPGDLLCPISWEKSTERSERSEASPPLASSLLSNGKARCWEVSLSLPQTVPSPSIMTRDVSSFFSDPYISFLPIIVCLLETGPHYAVYTDFKLVIFLPGPS